MEEKSIKIKKITWKRLQDIKLQYEEKSLDEIISNYLKRPYKEKCNKI